MAWSKKNRFFVMEFKVVRRPGVYIDIEKIDLEPHYIIENEKFYKVYRRLVKYGHTVAQGYNNVMKYMYKYLERHPMLLVYRVREPVIWDNLEGRGYLIFRQLPIMKPLIEIYLDGKLVERRTTKIRELGLRSVLKS